MSREIVRWKTAELTTEDMPVKLNSNGRYWSRAGDRRRRSVQIKVAVWPSGGQRSRLAQPEVESAGARTIPATKDGRVLSTGASPVDDRVLRKSRSALNERKMLFWLHVKT